MDKRIKPLKIESQDNHEGVIVNIDAHKFTQQDYNMIQILSEVIKEGNEMGEFEYGNMKITINDLTTFEKDLIFITNDNNEKD